MGKRVAINRGFAKLSETTLIPDHARASFTVVRTKFAKTCNFLRNAGFLICLLGTLSTLNLLYADSSDSIPVYFKNMKLSKAHKERLAQDLHRYRHADNLWDVLREDFTLPHYERHPAVKAKIAWFMRNQEYVLRAASRAAPYLHYILQEVKKRNLPAELVLLPIVESEYDPFSLSYKGAAGIWQLMPDTATGLGVKQDWWYDGRRDVIASTKAALTYLDYLSNFFEGNWLLAIAAYNTGEGNVLAALKKNIRDRKKTDFWSLPLAQQTRDYVPSVMALATIINHPEQYPLYFPPLKNAPYLAQVDVGTQINLKFAAALAGISYHTLMRLNSGFSRTATAKHGPYKLLLPIENVEQFAENIARSFLEDKRFRGIIYEVKSGDSLAALAKKFSTPLESLKTSNHLTSNALRPGTRLLIPHSIAAKPESALLQLSMATKTKIRIPPKPVKNIRYKLQPGDTIYVVRANDKLESIAKKFKITQQELKTVNNLNTKALIAGKKLIIPTHAVLVATNHKKPSLDGIPYLVKRGDTLDRIARKFDVKIADIRVANLMSTNAIQEGDKITIPPRVRG